MLKSLQEKSSYFYTTIQYRQRHKDGNIVWTE